MALKRRILLFDGVCNLCDGLVQFTIKRDSRKIFLFAALQSKSGREILTQYHLPTESLDTFVFVDGDKCFTKSSAGLNVLRLLGGIWSLFYVFILVPAPLRDWIYDRLAKTRYRIFGKKDQCLIPSPELKERFLN
jgi:predicted DCC family thiol-disulfide oxidoreductase YuxK